MTGDGLVRCQPHEALGIGDRQGTNEYRVDNAVNRRGEPDTDRERDDDERRKARLTSDMAGCIAEVLLPMVDPFRDPHAADVFLDARGVAELPNRRGTCVSLRHAARQVVLGLTLDVIAHLAIEIVKIGPPRPHDVRSLE
jgi:hypothetical protein